MFLSGNSGSSGNPGAGGRRGGREQLSRCRRRHAMASKLVLLLPLLLLAALAALAAAAPLPSEIVDNFAIKKQGAGAGVGGAGHSGTSPLEWRIGESAAGANAAKTKAPPPSAPVDVDEVATWWPPQLVEQARRAVVGISPKGRGLDIEPVTAPPAAGSAGVLVDASALLVGGGGGGGKAGSDDNGADDQRALLSSLAASVPAGTRFVLTSRRAVSAGFSQYDVALSDGRRAEARLAYADAFYPVAVLVVVDGGVGSVGTAAATAGVAAAASAPLPAATLYPPPEDDARTWPRSKGTSEQQQEEALLSLEAATSASSTSSNSTTTTPPDVVVVEPNDPLLFLGQAPPEKGATGGATTGGPQETTFVGYVSDLRAAFPKSRSSGRGVRGVIARALVARKSPGPGGAAFDVSGKLFGLDVDRDVRGLVAPADKKAEVYVLPSVYLRDALARAVAATFVKDEDASSSSPPLPPQQQQQQLLFPRADGGFAATLVPLGIAVDRYKLDASVADAVRRDARLSGWPNAGGTVPKVIKVSGVDFGGIGDEGEDKEGGVRAGDIIVAIEGPGDGIKRMLGDDLHALDAAFARAAASAADANAAAKKGAASVFLSAPSPSSSFSSSLLRRRRPVVRLVVSRHGELLTVAARGVRLDNDNEIATDGTTTTTTTTPSLLASPKAERVLSWAGCRFVDPPMSSRRLYQFGGAGVMIAACDRDSPLSAAVAADPREEDESSSSAAAAAAAASRSTSSPSSSSSPSQSPSTPPPNPPPSKTPVIVTAIDGLQTPDLDALAALLSRRMSLPLQSSSSPSSPSSSSASSSPWNTTVAYRSIHTGRDTYSYVEGVSLVSPSPSSPFVEFLWDAHARSWVARTTAVDPTTNSTTATTKTLSPAESAPLLPLSAEEYRTGKRNGNGASAAAAAASAPAFFSRGKLGASPAAASAAAAAAFGGGDEPPAAPTHDDPLTRALSPTDKPSSRTEAASEWLSSLAARALGRAPTHAAQSTWGTPEALLRIKQQAVQVAISDALPLEHTDATPSAVGTGFVVDSSLGIVATNAHVCGPTIGGWEVMFFDGSVAPARQLWYSPTQDIALLSVEPALIPFPNATAEIVSWKTLSDADKPELSSQMEPVLEVGSPARFAFTTLQGVYLGASYRAQDEVGRWRTRNYLKVHTLIQSVGGSSGGAVFNKLGKIVAIHFAGGSNSEFISKYSASPYLWNSFEVAGDYVASAVAFYRRLYGGKTGGNGGGGGGGAAAASSSLSSSSSSPPPPSFSSFFSKREDEDSKNNQQPIKEPVRGGSGLVLDLVPLENAGYFFGMPPALAAEAALPGAPRPRSAMVVAGFEPGSPTKADIERNGLLFPGDIIWEIEDVATGKKERIGGDLIRLDELSGLAVERSLYNNNNASSSSSSSSPASPLPPHLTLTVLRRGQLVENVTLPVYDLTSDRVRRALSWNGALFHDVSDRTRNYYQVDVVDVKSGDGKRAGQGVFASYRAEGSAWPRFYHGANGGGSGGKSSTAFAKYLVYEVDGVATPDLDAMIGVACAFENQKKKENASSSSSSSSAFLPPTPSVVVARDLQDDSFPRGEALELPVSQEGLASTFEAPRLYEWDAARLVWRQRVACSS